MKKLLQGATAVAAFLAATPAFATEGWYGRVDAGYSFAGSNDISPWNASADLENDWVESLGLGFAFDNGFRLEGEFSHRFNELDTATVASGDAHVWAAMLNAYVDFNKSGAVQPYLGVGVGAARQDSNAWRNGPVRGYDDSETSLAYQGLAGIAFMLSEQLALDIGYRYFAAPDGEFSGTNPAPTTFSTDYDHHSATVGLRWQFAAPPPPPPPPPPPAPPPPPPPPPPAACPTSEFMVYFEWDRSNLNQAAMETIDSAVANARACNLTAVSVVGHTDTSGSADYNLGLSDRRASVVRDALVARGIGATSITTAGRGEAELARATRDGVREPLNRRTAVTITFQ
ncbi:MAG: OmpA family protein [Hyphomonadaceae bacterium]|nr:OmpA family protein [Hyphomonadaceae bacterium]